LAKVTTVKLRLDADVLAALRASGEGWQTRINDVLRAALKLTGQIKIRALPVITLIKNRARRPILAMFDIALTVPSSKR